MKTCRWGEALKHRQACCKTSILQGLLRSMGGGWRHFWWSTAGQRSLLALITNKCGSSESLPERSMESLKGMIYGDIFTCQSLIARIQLRRCVCVWDPWCSVEGCCRAFDFKVTESFYACFQWQGLEIWPKGAWLMTDDWRNTTRLLKKGQQWRTKGAFDFYIHSKWPLIVLLTPAAKVQQV